MPVKVTVSSPTTGVTVATVNVLANSNCQIIVYIERSLIVSYSASFYMNLRSRCSSFRTPLVCCFHVLNLKNKTK